MFNYQIVKFLGSVFTPELDITSHLKFLNFAADTLGNKLDGPPTILPELQGAPAEVPRIQLASSDKKWVLSISLARTDLFYFNPSISEEDSIQIEEFSSILYNFFSNYQEQLDLRVQRLAFITERVSLKDQASDYIIDKFCKPEYKQERRPFNNVKKFELHSLKNYPWNTFQLNSWVRIKSIDYKDPARDGVNPVILLINDLNTLSIKEDPEKTFSAGDIKRYFKEIPEHLDSILKKYFT